MRLSTFRSRSGGFREKGPTRRQSQRRDLSRLVLAHESRQLPSWLIFDVRQKMLMSLRISSPLPARPCRFSLGLQDDSVFADFDVDADGYVFLRRISFDGHGCCD